MNKREEAEQFLRPDNTDRSCTRVIDIRDGSVWPMEDTGYRHGRKPN